MNIEEVIEYLEAELADANTRFELARGKDAQEALCQLIKSSTIQKILEDISTPEKRYSELTMGERLITFENWQAICLEEDIPPYDSFEEYDKEQLLLDLTFDVETLECIG